LIFNNGDTTPGERYSSVDELVLSVDSTGRYSLGPGKKYGPDQPVWSYAAPRKADFYSFNISGAMRLANGNTLICSGAQGIIFEVTPENRIVWQYNVPPFGERGTRTVFRHHREIAGQRFIGCVVAGGETPAESRR
jgi:hypothetical protein